MGSFTAGSVVLVTFPFTDLSSAKLRPAVVLASAGRGDWILCQVTSNPYTDTHAIRIEDEDFASGSLQHISFVRPGKLFTANQSIVRTEVGRLDHAIFTTVLDGVINILKGGKQ